MRIILGSGSKQRKKILERMGVEFEVMVSHIDEKGIRHEDPRKLTLALAKAKADALLPHIADPALLITADQVVVCTGKIFEKPANADEARQFLQAYGTHPAETVNGVAVTNTKTGNQRVENETSRVYFKHIPEAVIERLIQEGNVFSQAGAFSIDDPLFFPYIDKVEGSRESVEGLPIKLLEHLMKEVSS
ncbi:MAG: septum formation protein Maf [Candidatus Wildermuthbacteria bacterium]|nr:septum formation protein Maf [Candidatus Wildermuthbacteria bacterium]